MGDRALDVIEIVPTVKFYDYEAKYAPGGLQSTFFRHRLNQMFTKKSEDWLFRRIEALGCRGVSRADFRYDDRRRDGGDLVCLEVNTQPGMTETSLVPELAAHAGITFEELVRWMVEDASLNR